MFKKIICLLSVFVFLNLQAQESDFIPNNPIGEAKGIYPGRVTWVRDAKVCTWNGVDGKWWEDTSIDQKRLDKMFDKSIKALTGEKNLKKAWEKLFVSYNQSNGRGSQGWKEGESIVVKINLNNCFTENDVDNEIDQSTQSTRSLLRHLTEYAGVSQDCIVIYDASVGFRNRAIPDRIYKPLHQEFPGVRWMSARGGNGREAADWVDDAISFTNPEGVKLGTKLPKAVVEATYLINAALLKGHEMTAVTLCAKNHFGTIMFPNMQHNSATVHPMRFKMGDYTAMVDLMGSPSLGKKTMLYIVDGLYGMQTNVGEPKADRDRWDNLFDGEWSASYFMSQDPVAIESVCMDFLIAEFGPELGFSGAPAFPKGAIKNCDNYLYEAATGKNAQFGEYKPNGVPTGSLGVFEHWNNPVEMKYSRNMGKDYGIELYRVK